MALYLSSTVRLWSCGPIILALPLNRWWLLPSPRLQPARGLGELGETDLGNASGCTRVCESLKEQKEDDENIRWMHTLLTSVAKCCSLVLLPPPSLPVFLSLFVISTLCFLLPLLLSPEEDFEKLPASTVPEMQRTNLAPVILQLKALGIDNVLRFSFLSVSGSLCIHGVAVMCSPTVKGIVLYILISENGPWPLGGNA